MEKRFTFGFYLFLIKDAYFNAF